MKNQIIALVGMCGSGKSIATEILENRGYKKVYFGGVTMEKLKEEGLEVNETNERMIREQLRKDYGMAAYAVVSIPRIKEYIKEGNVVIDGLYSWDELKALRETFDDLITVICVVTDKKIRCERLAKREIRPLTKEQVDSRDISEIENLAKGGPIAYADYFIDNNGNLEDYRKRLDNILKEVGKD